ncbi:MAG: hypothetical protein GXY13_12195 [Acidimicrobiales bacterium]|nr:hypothetical protein [Acidimicrobiales bacterium]
MSDALDQLLVVQGHDLKVTQLHTRRDGLPERAEAAEVEATRAERAKRLEAVDSERHRLDRDQGRLDDEVATLRSKAEAAEKTLYGGAITAAHELQALQDQIASLGRRVGELEDQELEIMVEREPFDEEAAAIGAELEALAARAADVQARITVAEAEIDAELDSERAARDAAAAEVPADLLAEYETLRASRSGIGVARLEHGTCQGCHIKLSAVELDRIKGLPDDELVHCEECGRLLVR